MPAPAVIVTFEDQDGTEWPQVVPVVPGVDRATVVTAAKAELLQTFAGTDMKFRVVGYTGVWDGITNRFIRVAP